MYRSSHASEFNAYTLDPSTWESILQIYPYRVQTVLLPHDRHINNLYYKSLHCAKSEQGFHQKVSEGPDTQNLSVAHFVPQQRGLIHVKWVRNTQMLQKKKGTLPWKSGRQRVVVCWVFVRWWKEGRREAVTPGVDRVTTQGAGRSQVDVWGVCRRFIYSDVTPPHGFLCSPSVSQGWNHIGALSEFSFCSNCALM